MTRSSSSEPFVSHAAGPRTRRRTWHHLAMTFAVALLVVTGPRLAPETTGALYTAEASATVTGFRAEPVCDSPDVPTVQSILAGLDTTLHWGFSPDGPAPWTSALGEPSTSESDGTLACDDGVLGLAPGQTVWTDHDLAVPSTIVLVFSRPSTGGTVLSVRGADGGLDVRHSGSTLAVWAWSAPDAATLIASTPLEGGSVHVLALTIDEDEVVVRVDDESLTGPLPAALAVLPAEVELGLGALEASDGAPVQTATFTATELAVVPGLLETAVVGSLLDAAAPGTP